MPPRLTPLICGGTARGPELSLAIDSRAEETDNGSASIDTSQ
jgi:hypothetical protein